MQRPVRRLRARAWQQVRELVPLAAAAARARGARIMAEQGAAGAGAAGREAAVWARGGTLGRLRWQEGSG